MEFRILGNLEVHADGCRLAVGGPREQKVLATLLLNAGRLVPLPRLVDMVWEADPPVSAAKQVRNSVSTLRQLLKADGPGPVIATDGAGYRLDMNGALLDAQVFETQAAQAATAASAGRCAEAARLLRSALDLWRGPALAGLPGHAMEAAAVSLDQRRLAVAETYCDHLLTLGRDREAAAELTSLVASHPLREKAVAQLMLALYRDGQRADALALYQDTRSALADQLGLDPGPGLQQLHQRILAADPGLQVPEPGQDKAGAVGQARLAGPQQLPGAPPKFTGRGEELDTLAGLLAGHGQAGGTVLVSAIGGTAGIGKTALAVHWAHRVAGHFPDGQLFVNLRGFGPSGTPMQPAEALRGFLTALGVPTERIPAGLEEQAALYRTLLAGKKMLIVLDNARETAQVRPLLPGSSGCLVVVTSRSQLGQLVAVDGAHPVNLGLLTEAEARQLLADRLGDERTAAEPGPVDELISLCSRLPLALCIAAARAATRPGFPLAALAAEMRDTRHRLNTLEIGDDASVRAAFSWSYRQLSDPAARMFRLLGLHLGPDISVPAAASLAGMTDELTRQALAELARAHLLAEHMPGRFAFHDLLRDYAAEQAEAGETEAERHAATARLLDHYLHTAHAAALLLFPARNPLMLGDRHPAVRPEYLCSDSQALAWFEAEQHVLLAAVTLASGAGFSQHVWQIAWTLANFLDRRSRWHDWQSIQLTALAAARQAGDMTGQAHACSLLGRAAIRLGHYDEACEHLHNALALFRSLSDRPACAHTYLDLGWVATKQGRHGDALAPILRALELYRSAGHEMGEALTLANLGWH
ncbi:MAG TPA: BTAD domain-containing putative transcriptional regulator [Streptosporangiaceae bacterium]|nr:BTAD domain-containing putative transcriptional regulator [Streptosporangiaceae bacterium]